MACKAELTDGELDELCCKLKEYAKLAKKDNLTSQAIGKITKDNPLWKDIRTEVDSSVFPACKDDRTKPYMTITKTSCKKFLEKSAEKLEVKKKGKGLPEGSTWEKELLKNLGGTTLTGVTKESSTGNVKGMTDTKNYTGSHKERFGEDGKGKGIDGRENRHDNKGYVGNYKGDGSYDQKVKK
ncbi:tubulin polymerization-promoting protein family member 2-like [Pecten maximus]|uniref:tubulin polymerization-promoting protein family member 2-like n=1 Tax=Pecten maximus TaxID=6579 RepID=UPI0014585598|nr:tubulin polymerization-promoting protein family member 2-like [Pecten maximus]